MKFLVERVTEPGASPERIGLNSERSAIVVDPPDFDAIEPVPSDVGSARICRVADGDPALASSAAI